MARPPLPPRSPRRGIETPKGSDAKLDPDDVRAARDFLLTGRRARWDESPREHVAKRLAALREAQQRSGVAPPQAPAPAEAPPPASPARRADDLSLVEAEAIAAAPAPAPALAPEVVLAATGVRRSGAGWRASCIHRRGVDSRFVADARYGGYAAAFLHALEVRDGFYRDRRLPIPWQASGSVGGETVATDVERVGDHLVVRWQGEEHHVEGDDAEDVATELALDLFVEWVSALPAD